MNVHKPNTHRPKGGTLHFVDFSTLYIIYTQVYRNAYKTGARKKNKKKKANDGDDIIVMASWRLTRISWTWFIQHQWRFKNVWEYMLIFSFWYVTRSVCTAWAHLSSSSKTIIKLSSLIALLHQSGFSNGADSHCLADVRQYDALLLLLWYLEKWRCWCVDSSLWSPLRVVYLSIDHSVCSVGPRRQFAGRYSQVIRPVTWKSQFGVDHFLLR